MGIIACRVLSALSMFIWPFWGLLATYFFDWIDCYVLMGMMKYSRQMYHQIDKPLDWFGYFVELLIMVRFPQYMPICLLLLVWRFFGQYLHQRIGRTWVFVIFANYFEIMYMWFIAAPLDGVSFGMSTSTFMTIFYLLIGAKILQEMWLHMIGPWYLPRNRLPGVLHVLTTRNIGY